MGKEPVLKEGWQMEYLASKRTSWTSSPVAYFPAQPFSCIRFSIAKPLGKMSTSQNSKHAQKRYMLNKTKISWATVYSVTKLRELWVNFYNYVIQQNCKASNIFLKQILLDRSNAAKVVVISISKGRLCVSNNLWNLSRFVVESTKHSPLHQPFGQWTSANMEAMDQIMSP